VIPVDDDRHVADVQLAACRLSQGEGPVDAASAAAMAHVASCPVCARRYEQLGWRLEDLRDADEAAFDQVFTPEHLETQRAHILRRLEAIGRQAKVLRFPSRATRRQLAPAVRTGRAARWVAAAAVAGLVAGLSLGLMMDFRSGPPLSPARTTARLSGSQPPATHPAARPDATADTPRPSTASALTDEDFLTEIDRALWTQRAAELEALDALTPRIREVRMASMR
jgi:hypothetical protein